MLVSGVVVLVLGVMAMSSNRGRNLKAYVDRQKALKRYVARHNVPCWICGRPIDTTLRAGDPMEFTADHVKELYKGGHLLGPLKPAHRGCNSRRSNRKELMNLKPFRRSRRW